MLPARSVSYDKRPKIPVPGLEGQAWRGWPEIGRRLGEAMAELGGARTILVVDLYAGASAGEIRDGLAEVLRPVLSIDVDEALLPEERLAGLVAPFLGDDPVFGRLSALEAVEYFDPAALERLRARIEGVGSGLVLVTGIAASLLLHGDILVYADMARWEIQGRFRRKEAGNWGFSNRGGHFGALYKQGYFLDWRILDRHKTRLFGEVDFWLDCNRSGDPRMASGRAFRAGMDEASRRPFRVVPFFDPGPWGGQWLREVCDLPPEAPNYAWCFDCVPEENSLLLEIGGIELEFPALDLVLTRPRELLGERVYGRFGAEFPIRFDFLDTMGGGNLSLQVHPLKEYIKERFGIPYTQDESYYLMDAGEGAAVYLGLREDVDPAAMVEGLREARTSGSFDAEAHMARWPARRHDHFLIPAGTVHCSGRNAMVLEISATPYIFTFKLWDWGRMGLDGRPRPIHLEHGERVIEWERRAGWVRDNLVNRFERVAGGEGWTEERTGLHELEFIETRRHWFSVPVLHHTRDTVHVLNLVQGRAAVVESPRGAFAPFTVHYAETFIVPASVGEYLIRPADDSGETLATIQAWVRP